MTRVVFSKSGMALAALMLLNSPPALACAVCFGKSDSALAKGMNMGIFSLLGVIGLVLSGVAAFFIFLARRTANLPAEGSGTELPETVTRS